MPSSSTSYVIVRFQKYIIMFEKSISLSEVLNYVGFNKKKRPLLEYTGNKGHAQHTHARSLIKTIFARLRKQYTLKNISTNNEGH